jgi:hypothetical protein
MLTVMASAAKPAIYLASVVLVATCVTFLIIIPTILLSMLRNTGRTADYLEHLANRPKELGIFTVLRLLCCWPRSSARILQEERDLRPSAHTKKTKLQEVASLRNGRADANCRD